MSLSSDRRERVDAICHAALELPRDARASYVSGACAGDAELKAEVESLLAHASAAEQLLNVSVGALAASIVPSANEAPIEPGTRLGSYEVRAPLGAGGQGRVFRARDTDLRRDVALKVLTGHARADDSARAALLREARRAASLSHASVCQVFHVGDSAHGPFMVMELVDGQTLRDLVGAGRLSIDRVCRIGAEVARALDHAHAHAIVHRGLKSANVMLTRDGHVKVLDFGIAATRPGADLERTLSKMDGDEIGSMAGTVPYIAPEVLRGEAADIASDVWALGVVLYELATGRLPFAGDSPSDVVAAILRDPPPPLPADTPAPIAQLITRCLSKDSTQRPARAGEIALALEVTSSAWGMSASAPREASRGVPQVTNSLATDGKYLYFSWQEDLGDLWVADLVR